MDVGLNDVSTKPGMLLLASQSLVVDKMLPNLHEKYCTLISVPITSSNFLSQRQLNNSSFVIFRNKLPRWHRKSQTNKKIYATYLANDTTAAITYSVRGLHIPPYRELEFYFYLTSSWIVFLMHVIIYSKCRIILTVPNTFRGSNQMELCFGTWFITYSSPLILLK